LGENRRGKRTQRVRRVEGWGSNDVKPTIVAFGKPTGLIFVSSP
jgi:hypothetical protein